MGIRANSRASSAPASTTPDTMKSWTSFTARLPDRRSRFRQTGVSPCAAPRAIRPAMSMPRFHLAFPVRDLGEARAVYGGLLGCPEGRCSDDWVDFDFH